MYVLTYLVDTENLLLFLVLQFRISWLQELFCHLLRQKNISNMAKRLWTESRQIKSKDSTHNEMTNKLIDSWKKEVYRF